MVKIFVKKCFEFLKKLALLFKTLTLSGDQQEKLSAGLEIKVEFKLNSIFDISIYTQIYQQNGENKSNLFFANANKIIR